MTLAWQERVVSFGPSAEMVGIFTEPSANKSNQSKALIIVNAGVLHRVGACRISVDMARQLATQGWQVFRFDYSGLGDSGFSGVEGDYQDKCKSEIIAAMDELQQRFAISGFVIHGLCSGSVDAFNAALVDSRIVAISQIDTFAYRTRRYYLRKLREKFSSLASLGGFIHRRIKALATSPPEPEPEQDISTFEWSEYPDSQVAAEGYRTLVERGVRLLVIFTGSWNDLYNYKDQIFDMYSGVEFGDAMDLLYLPNTGHLMSDKESRALLVERLKQLLESTSSK